MKKRLGKEFAKQHNGMLKHTYYDQNIESSYIEYLDVNNLYWWAMSQKFPTNGLKWVEDLSQCNEDFIKKLWWK